MSAPKFTADQLNAIEARGGTILVSAAAGSGKTAVLVERVTRLLTDPENPVDADRLVVVTFTKAAAAEMRERIDKRIAALLKDDPDNMSLRRQKLLLGRAHIDTIHSFCASCLREFFARAGIAPDFRIADDSEIRAIRAEALGELIDEAYIENTEGFRTLVELLGDERSDRTLSRVITELADYVTAYPDPDARLAEFAAMYRSDLPVEKTGWGQWLLERTGQLMDYAMALNDRALDELTLYPEIEAKCRPVFDIDGALFASIKEMSQTGDWDGIYRLISGSGLFQRMTGPAKKSDGTKFSDDPDYQRITAGRNARKEIVTSRLAKLLCADSTGFADDRSRLQPMVAELCRLTEKYRSSLARRKSDRKLLDYDDLEHMTAGLLFYEKDGVLYRTDTARELAERFDELLIDEYQDTNYTQDLIFRAISSEQSDEIGQGSNLFLVGDIKQSIYSFRKAVPQLFLNRLKAYPLYNPDAPAFPAKIILDRNFRSRPEVTDAVNFVFEQIMTAQRGGIVYDEEQQLVAGREFPEGSGFETELHLFSAKTARAADADGEGIEDAADDDDRCTVEARYCARLVRDMVGKAMVTDGDTLRPAEYGDFCIMRRGVRSGAGQAFIEQFEALGIPVAVSVDEGYFRQPEVCVILSLLRAVDNPLLNIPLTAALRSPVFGFDSRSLAALRAGGQKEPVYLSLLRRAKEGDSLCVRASELLESLRTAAAALPCDRLLRLIYNRTGYLAAVQSMPGGSQRRSNLLLLLEYAKTSESTGSHGLSGFLRMIERMEEDGRAQSAAPQGGSCVTVRTMHNAKGLQFPICIVSGLGGNKNNSILSSPLPIHERLGVGAGIYDLQRRLRYPTVQQKVIARARFSDEVDEELRVLYVAMTRAVDKLILISAASRATTVDRMLEGVAANITEEGVQPLWLETSPSMGSWVTACALRHPGSGELRQKYNALYDGIESDCPFTVKVIEADSPMLAPIEITAEQQETEPQADETVVEALRRSMDYTYPYAGWGDIPAKVTASQTHRHDDTPADGNASLQKIHISPVRPSFMMSRGLTPAERGTALHRFMQFCDLERARTDAAAEVQRLVSSRFLTPREGEAVDTKRVERLFGGDLGRLMDSAQELHREWRFTVELPAGRLQMFTQAQHPGEMIVLQGECDLLLIKDGEAVVVDYKTDQVSSTDVLIERYRDQLVLYADAVAAVTGLPVRCYIYSFRLSELRHVPLS